MTVFPLARFPWRVISKAIRELRSLIITRKVTERSKGARIVVGDPFIRIIISIGEDARLILKGRLRFESFQGLREVIYLSLGAGSTLTIDGDFSLGPGCKIWVEPGGELYIGGRRNENVSGITERSRIMVRRRVLIGKDLVCSWGVFITDCDWHDIVGHENTEETLIGDHVWIGPNCSVLKGSVIKNDCIIATGSVTHRTSFPDGSLVGGVPARVLATEREWVGDMS
jgi:acetyltransferase-like isoleucine patch superfamily enzyme